MPNPVQALRWQNQALELLDQRHLPHTVTTVICTSAAEVAAAIRNMVVRGAPAIGCAAAFGFVLEAYRQSPQPMPVFRTALAAAKSLLLASRPTAVNLSWALKRMEETLAATTSKEPPQVAADLEAAAVAIFNADVAANMAMGKAGAELIADGARIMTHCNTGALATAGHGTALGVIRSARDQGKRLSVIANETRPFLQGARLTTWELAQEAIPVTLATDSMAGYLMQQGLVDLIIVGADRIAANGDTANKIGTYTLAVLAWHHRLPFYVAAPLSTIDMTVADGQAIPIEQRSPDEVTGYGGVRWAPDGIAAVHPAFDVTPAGLISALITEKGLLRNPDATGLRRLFQDATTS
jgi:methylthioribose-1-phosphate isomerase